MRGSSQGKGQNKIEEIHRRPQQLNRVMSEEKQVQNNLKYYIWSNRARSDNNINNVP